MLAHRIVAEGMSVRATEEAVALALADGPGQEGRPRSGGPSRTPPALSDLADRLSDHFETRVKVEIGRRKGSIIDRVRHRGRPGADRRSIGLEREQSLRE